MKKQPTMAHSIDFFLCEDCAAVHIGMWRNGRMFAEAIPLDIEAVAAALAKAIADSRTRKQKAAH
jgi:hypothetical protein